MILIFNWKGNYNGFLMILYGPCKCDAFTVFNRKGNSPLILTISYFQWSQNLKKAYNSCAFLMIPAPAPSSDPGTWDYVCATFGCV